MLIFIFNQGFSNNKPMGMNGNYGSPGPIRNNMNKNVRTNNSPYNGSRQVHQPQQRGNFF